MAIKVMKTKLAIHKIQLLFGKKKLSVEKYYELHKILQELLDDDEYTQSEINRDKFRDLDDEIHAWK